MFTLRELTNWFGITVFELIIFLVSFFIYTIFLAFKVDELAEMNWWIVHSPLFLSDAFSAYFSIIVFIRLCLEGFYRTAFFRTFWSMNQIIIMALVKLLLCLRLEGDPRVSQAEILAPVFFYLLLLILRTCQTR